MASPLMARSTSPIPSIRSHGSNQRAGMRSASMAMMSRRSASALTDAQTSDRPTLIACKTVIGYGAPTKAGTAGVHGAALGAKEIEGAREKLGWTAAPFEVPDEYRRGLARQSANGLPSHMLLGANAWRCFAEGKDRAVRGRSQGRCGAGGVRNHCRFQAGGEHRRRGAGDAHLIAEAARCFGESAGRISSAARPISPIPISPRRSR